MVALQTYYKGYKFRSRLEARWAVLFDALSIKYEYEAQGFECSNGIKYLPDFVLHGGTYRCPDPLYVEVKGQMTQKDAEKIRAFAGLCPLHDYVDSCETCPHCHIYNGEDHHGYSDDCDYDIDIGWYGDGAVGLYPYYQYYGTNIEHPIYLVTDIPEDITLTSDGNWDCIGMNVSYYNFETVDGDYFPATLGAKKGGGWGLFGADSNYWCDMDIEKTKRAYIKARQARFEHGENNY